MLPEAEFPRGLAAMGALCTVPDPAASLAEVRALASSVGRTLVEANCAGHYRFDLVEDG
jgi:hypothetical protein